MPEATGPELLDYIRRLIRNDFDAAFHEVDVLIGPTSPTAAFRIGEKARAFSGQLIGLLFVFDEVWGHIVPQRRD